MILLHSHLATFNLNSSSKAGTAVVCLPLKSLFGGSRRNSSSRYISHLLSSSIHFVHLQEQAAEVWPGLNWQNHFRKLSSNRPCTCFLLVGVLGLQGPQLVFQCKH
jgi:hypothetical protein